MIEANPVGPNPVTAGVIAANSSVALTVSQLIGATSIESSGNASGTVAITAASYIPGMQWTCRNNNTDTSTTTFFGIVVPVGCDAVIRINSGGYGERVTPNTDGYDVTRGANLADASVTINPNAGCEYTMPAGTMTVNRTVTLGVAGVNVTYGGPRIIVIREDATAHTLTFKDDASTTIYVSASATAEAVVFDYDKDLTHYVYITAIPISHT